MNAHRSVERRPRRAEPVATAALVLLTVVTALTAAAGAATVAVVAGGTDRLFAAAAAPDWVQMHAGPVDAAAIDAFAATADGVIDHQVAPALRVDNDAVRLDGRSDMARTGVMELLLVRQNDRFDLLLGSDDRPVAPARGQIAVPTFYMQEYGLEPGDRVELAVAGATRSFTVVDRVRDAQMNPGVVNSKRFVLADADWTELAEVLPVQSLVTFRIAGDPVAFAAAYRDAGLPADGPAVDGALLRLIGALTDGVVAAVLLLLAVTVFAVSALCQRLVILTSLENERRRIALLRTLGFSSAHVIREQLRRYIVLAVCGAAVGAGLAVPVAGVVTARIVADTGGAATGSTIGAVVVAGALVAGATVLGAAVVMRRVRRVTPAAAELASAPRRVARWLPASAPLPVPLWMALRTRLARPGGTVLLLTVVAVAVVVAVLPARLAQTVSAPSFASTLGIGDSDLRAFVPASLDPVEADAVVTGLREHPDVVGVVASETRRVSVEGPTGYRADLAVETVPSHTYPLKYRSGREPAAPDEIALSTLAAQSWEASVGDVVTAGSGAGSARGLRVVGLYQDITNGGRSARTLGVDASAPVLWRTVVANVRAGADAAAVADALSRAFPAATVTDVDRFVAQTLGGTVGTLRSAAVGAAGFALVLLVVVVSFLTRLESARDRRGLRELRSIGQPASAIRTTLVLRPVVVAVVAAPLGLVAAEALGPSAFGAMLSSLGGGPLELAPDGLAGPAAVVVAITGVAAAAAAGSLVPAIHPRTKAST
ncbi:MAG: hypothetical protein PGN24_12780 [Microbacterium arborescens]